MSTFRISVFYLWLAVLCVSLGNSSSEKAENPSETTPPGRPISADPPSEQSPGSEKPSDRQTTADNAVDPSEVPQKSGGDAAKQEKLVVAFVPDYPSKITQPWMLSNETHFIMFYASWCSYSEAAMPHFKDALQYIVDRNISGVHLGKIEILKNKDITKNFNIKSTPTFLMYHHKARYVFEGEVSRDNLIAFMHRVTEINLTEVSSASQLSQLQRDHPVVFLLAHDGQRDPDWHYIYSQVAREKGLLAKFADTTKIDLVQSFNISKFPTLLVLKDGTSLRFSDSLTMHNLAKWITREQHPSFPTVDQNSFRPYTKFALGRKLVILLVHEDPSDQRITEKRLIDTVKRVATSRKLFPLFQFLQLSDVEFAERMTQSQISELPYLFVYEHSTGFYYPFQAPEDGGGVTEEAIKDFCNAIKHKKIEPLGGRQSYMATLRSLWMRVYTTYQAMVTHRPYLSLGAVISLLCVTVFYTVMCVRRNSSSARSTRKLRGRARIARDRARREHARNSSDTRTGLQNGSIVRRRRKGEQEEGEGEGEGGEGSEEGSEQGSQDSSEENQHRHAS